MFLQIQGIQKSFGAGDSRVDVLKGLDLDIERGEFCVLLGPSGSGKSTLLNIIGGIDSADEGNLVIDGERLADMSEKKLSLYRRKHLGYIFQMYNLIPNLTVRENIEVGAYLSDHALDVDELRLIVQRALDGGEVKAAVFAQVDLRIADAVLLERARTLAKTDDLLKRIVGLAGDSEHLVARQQVGGQRDGQRVCAAGDLRADERGLGVKGARVHAL